MTCSQTFRKTLIFIKFGLFIPPVVLLYFYLSCPIYRFAEPVSFHGKFLHNPYQSIDSAVWRKYNFQVQSHVWAGVTNGRLNSDQLIDSIYKQFNYTYVATSDYQQINTYNIENERYIPTYEHGYNIPKVHQVCIGARKVLWRDYFLFQTLGNKQHIINELHKNCDLVALAHPKLRDGYSLNDMKYLSGYDLMEVLNNLRFSLNHWDMALSNGHLAYILADDDAHNVLNSNEVNRSYTLIQSVSFRQDSIVKALKNGLAYGVDFFRLDDEPMLRKVERSRHLPFLKSSKLFGDTLKVEVSESVFHIYFVGDGGKIIHEIDHTSNAQYIVQKNDSYVRVEIHCYDSSVLYLNPVVRTENENVTNFMSAEVNQVATWLKRIVGILIFSLVIYFWYFRLKRSLKS